MRRVVRLGIAGLAVGSALALVACATVRVDSDRDPSVDFSRYRTFDWSSGPVQALVDPSHEGFMLAPFSENTLLDQRVRRHVEAGLLDRGLVKVEDKVPDLALRYYVVFRDRTVLLPSADPFYHYRGGYLHPRYGSFYWGSGSTVRQVEEGTLVLDAIDVSRNQLVWRGWGVTRTKDFNYDELRVREAVKRMLREFPAG